MWDLSNHCTWLVWEAGVLAMTARGLGLAVLAFKIGIR
jgi:hypothetical protein